MSARILELRARPRAWAVLARGMEERRPVIAGYHGSARLLCPHVLGWRAGRAKALSFQIAAVSSAETTGYESERGWRSMFVDEIEDATLYDGTWTTPDDYAGPANGIDVVELAVEVPGPRGLK